MKSYTDLEQSKKLTKILPLESADMLYYCNKSNNTLISQNPFVRSFKETDTFSYLHCWSLAALLDVLPLGIYDEFDGCDYELEINMIDKMPRYIRLGDISHSKFPWDFEKDTLIDNIVESIIWLNDNNYFEL